MTQQCQTLVFSRHCRRRNNMVTVGDAVLCKQFVGIVRYVAMNKAGEPKLIGLELVEPNGNSDGSLFDPHSGELVQCFKTEKNYGTFVQVSEVIRKIQPVELLKKMASQHHLATKLMKDKNMLQKTINENSFKENINQTYVSQWPNVFRSSQRNSIFSQVERGTATPSDSFSIAPTLPTVASVFDNRKMSLSFSSNVSENAVTDSGLLPNSKMRVKIKNSRPLTPFKPANKKGSFASTISYNSVASTLNPPSSLMATSSSTSARQVTPRQVTKYRIEENQKKIPIRLRTNDEFKIFVTPPISPPSSNDSRFVMCDKRFSADTMTSESERMGESRLIEIPDDSELFDIPSPPGNWPVSTMIDLNPQKPSMSLPKNRFELRPQSRKQNPERFPMNYHSAPPQLSDYSTI